MELGQTLVDGLLKVVSGFHPALAPLLGLVIKYEPQIEHLGPVLQAAAKEGPGAIAAAEEHAPELAEAIREYVRTLPGSASTAQESEHQVARTSENVARQIIGLEPMTPEEERHWMDSSTPATDPRQGG